MNRRIADYIQRHRATYTKEALRQSLLQRGYNPAEVEEAFAAVEAGQVPPAGLTLRFWLIFIGYIVVLYGLTLVLFGLTPAGLFIVPILAVPLVLAAGASILIAALNRSAALGVTSGIVLVFVLPFVFLVVIAGSCLALTAPLLFTPQPPPPRSGAIDLRIDAPLSFEGSASATCSSNTEDGRVAYVSSEDAGTVDGDKIRVFVDMSFSDGYLNVELYGEASGPPSRVYSGGAGQAGPPGRGEVDIDAAPGANSGTVTFDQLPGIAPETGEAADVDPPAISGTLTWRCDDGG